MQTTCYSGQSLAAFLAGGLPADEEESVAAHVQTCAVCELRLAQLADDGSARAMLAEHRRRSSAHFAPSGELNELRERLHALGWIQSESASLSATARTARGDDSTQVAGQTGHVHSEPPPAPTVGKFEIIQPIGAGGFGVVYLARDKVLNRQVALKLARASVLVDPHLKSRFVREAEALARLAHPGIVPVYEAGEHDGTCYLAVGYCDGPTLEQWLREHGSCSDPRLAARIALRLAEAVEHAHSHGILHRDIKPANILLDRADQPREANSDLPFVPKLTDFGLAKLAEQQAETTISGVLLGTPQYMAPEQAAGLVERFGKPTDVYSLGAVLYELLTGRPPIRGATSVDTLRRVLIDEPQHPRDIAIAVADDLDAIVMKCLDKSPTRRYSSAAEMADDLRRYLEGRPTLARPLGRVERAARWVRRNPALSAVLGLVLMVVALAAGLYLSDQRLSDLRVAHDLKQAMAAYREDLYAAAQRYAAGDVSQTVELLKRQLPQPGRPDQRGLEWHYLWALTTHGTSAEASVGKDVYQIAIAPSGDQLAAAGMDRKLHLFQSRGLSPVTAFDTRHGETNGVAYSADGTQIATVGDDGFVRLWDAQTHKLLHEWRAHQAKAYNVVYFDRGTKLATCGEEPIIRLWDAATGKSEGVLVGHTGPVEAIVLSPVEPLLASASKDTQAIVWDLDSKSIRHRLAGHSDKLTCLAFSHDGKWLATGGLDCSIILWRHGEARRRSRGFHLDAVQAVAFTRDGRLLAGDRGGTIRSYRLGPQFPESSTEKALVSAEDHWQAHTGKVWSLAALAEADQFVSAGRDGQLRIWERGRNLVQRWKADGDDYYFADFDRDGTRLLTLRQRQGVEVFDGSPMKLRFSLRQEGKLWESMAILEGREQVAAATQSGEIVVWNWRSDNHLHTWKFGKEPIHRLTYSPAANLLAFIAYSREDVVLIDANTGEEVGTLPAPSCTDCAFSPDGRRLVVDTLNQLAVFDVASRDRLRLAPGHSANINALTYSPDGQMIATASTDRTIRLWTADGEPISELGGHAAAVHAVAFTPDGKSLVTGAEDGRLKVFHVATRRELLDINIEMKSIRRLAVSPDNRQIAVIGDDWQMAVVSVPSRQRGN